MLFLLTSAIISVLAGCAGEMEREYLPQIIRIDRDIVARATQHILATADTSALEIDAVATPGTESDTAVIGAPERTTFFTRDDGAIVFHLSHQNDPSHPIHLGLLRFQEEIYTRSEGTLVVDIFPDAIIGNDVANINMINANELDASAVLSWGMWSGINELAGLDSLPYIFTNYEEAWAAHEGALGQWVSTYVIEPHGGRVLGFWTNGLRHFTNNVRPIQRPEDLQGLIMRSPQIPIHLAMYDEFGAASIAIAFTELYDALAAGVADGQDNPLSNIHASRFYQVQRYLSLSNHMYTCAVVVVSTDLWDALTEEQQQILLDSNLIAARYQGDLTVSMENHQLRDIIASGTLVNEVDMVAFFEASLPIWEYNNVRFGQNFTNFVAAVRPYISDPNALAHRFSYY